MKYSVGIVINIVRRYESKFSLSSLFCDFSGKLLMSLGFSFLLCIIRTLSISEVQRTQKSIKIENKYYNSGLSTSFPCVLEKAGNQLLMHLFFP